MLSYTHLFAFYNFYRNYLLLLSSYRTIFMLYIRRYDIEESQPLLFLSEHALWNEGVGSEPYISFKAFYGESKTPFDLY